MMYRAIHVLVALACASSTADGQVIVEGVCDPDIRNVEKLELEKVPGTWHAYESLGEDSGVECPAVEITVVNGQFVYQRKFIDNRNFHSILGVANFVNGKILYPEKMFSSEKTEIVPYTILGTDSSTYATLYYCKQETPTTKEVIAWRFSKVIPIPDEIREKNRVTALLHPELENAAWRKYDQRDCHE